MKRTTLLSLLGTAVLLGGCSATSQREASLTEDPNAQSDIAQADDEEGQATITIEQEVGTDEPGDNELAAGAGSGSDTVKTADSATGTGGDVGQDEPIMAGRMEIEESRRGGAVAVGPGEAEEPALQDQVSVNEPEEPIDSRSASAQSDRAASESEQTANGRVASVQPDQGRLILDEQGERNTYHAESDALENVEPGQQVSVTFESRDGQNWVKDLERQQQDQDEQQKQQENAPQNDEDFEYQQ